MRKFLAVLFTLCLCLSFGAAAGAQETAGMSPAKKAFIKSITSDLEIKTRLFEKSSGSINVEITDISGLLAMDLKFKGLKDSKFLLNYKLDTPAKKMGFNVDANFEGTTSRGDAFIQGTRLILSRDIIQLFNLLDRSGLNNNHPMPEYLWDDSPELAGLWKNFIDSQNYQVPPEFKDLLVFFIEAIPDEYIISSGKETVLNLDHEGFSDVILSFARKIESEPERFAAVLAGCLDTGQSGSGLLPDLLRYIQSPDFPKSKEEISRKLKAGGIEISRLVVSRNAGADGYNTVVMDMNIYENKGAIRYALKYKRAGDSIKGDLDVDLSAKSKEIDVSFNIDGDFEQSPEMASADYSCAVSGEKQDISLFGAVLKIHTKSRYDQDVTVDIPVLTPSNSKKMLSGADESGELKVVLNGNQVNFDVQPFIMEGRAMAPVRNLAEAFNCRVSYRGDEVHVEKADKLIILYLNRNQCTVNGREKWIDVPPFIKDGRTMVPVRFIAEEMGCRVKLVGNTVFITSNSDAITA
ncbi:MAG: copper amine oxidase N-terminal domain-containing protein [Peptococcaceae bacterium]|nr:copper amine oxidase N-terminal domain-containing protein [Peptococcaceae bacterium]